MPDDEISDPTNFREMLQFVLADMRAGRIEVGWLADGLPFYVDAGVEIPEDAERVEPNHDDVPLIAGVMVMRLVDEQAVEAAARQARIGQLLRAPGGPNRAQRRAQSRQRPV